MPEKVGEDLYACQYCGQRFTNVLLADSCEKGHNMILVPMTKEEIDKLLMFIYTKQDGLLKADFMRRMTKYRRIKAPKNDLPDM